jgi:hypothetical protein
MNVAVNKSHDHPTGHVLAFDTNDGSQLLEQVTALGIGLLLLSTSWITHCPRGDPQSLLFWQYFWHALFVPSPTQT